MRKAFGAMALVCMLVGCGGSSSSGPNFVTINGNFALNSIIVNGTDNPCPVTVDVGDDSFSCSDDSYLNLSSNGDFLSYDGTNTQRGDYTLTDDGTLTLIDLEGDRETARLVQVNGGNGLRITFQGSDIATYIFTRRTDL
ncbi:hypothetical protein EON79_07340 [bacterium]|nr:MAG: hypothetical protein EON79_07340 [bacterium]